MTIVLALPRYTLVQPWYRHCTVIYDFFPCFSLITHLGNTIFCYFVSLYWHSVSLFVLVLNFLRENSSVRASRALKFNSRPSNVTIRRQRRACMALAALQTSPTIETSIQNSVSTLNM